MADLIISKIPEGDFPSIIQQLVAINNQVDPYYRNLTAKERIGKRSMAEGREGKLVNYYANQFFVQKSQAMLFPRFIYLKMAYNFAFKL